MTAHPKRPRQPRLPLIRDDEDVIAAQGPLWHIHRTEGDHVLPWNVLRTWGPAADCRWDPHSEPAADHPNRGVSYTATDLATAVLETFQNTRLIDPNTCRPRATSWTPTRTLRLLNLTDDWALRNGASAALMFASHNTCRAWARAISGAWPDLDGLHTYSVLTGRSNITLWARSADTFPAAPGFSEYLADDLLWDVLDRIAHRYRTAKYRMI